MTLEDIINQELQIASGCFEKLKDCVTDKGISKAITAIIKQLKKDINSGLANEYRGEFGYLRKLKNKQDAEDYGYAELLQNSESFQKIFNGMLLQKIRSKFAITLGQFITTCLHRFAEDVGLEYEFVEMYGCTGVIEVAKHLIQRPQDDNALISSTHGIDMERVKDIEDIFYAADENGKTEELIILGRIKFWQRFNTAQGKKLSLIEIKRQLLFEHYYYDKNDPIFNLVGSRAFERESVEKVIKDLYSCMKSLSTNSSRCAEYISPYATKCMSVDHDLIHKYIIKFQNTYPHVDHYQMSYLVWGELPDFSLDGIARVISGETTVWRCEESLCLT